MKIYICSICGYIAKNAPPNKCPQCGSDSDVFYEARTSRLTTEKQQQNVPGRHG